MHTVTAERVSKALRNPYLLAREANKLYYGTYRDNSVYGTAVLDEAWDNLILLDACQYDVFEAENTLPGRLHKRLSKASSTVGFLEHNFDGKRVHDTVYVTANPQLTRKSDDLDADFHSIINVWESDWDEEVGSVTPEAMAKRALEANDEFPNKRLILHFLQPHLPFIGKFGRSQFGSGFGSGFWTKVKEGDVSISEERLYAAYRENLQIALPSVRSLLEELPGRTVVTADHGQAFGERSFPLPIKEYGHPRETYMPCLTEVPWLVFDSDEEKRVTAEPPVERVREIDNERATSAEVESRLEQLGYKL